MNRWPHSDYYIDRHSERDLCSDFPGDEILIDGLRAMQLHFINNNVNIDIPVLRVMNTVHYIVAYMFTTSCSGDPIEYEIMAYDSLSRDKQLTLVTMIVLAAMLKRTGGYRAQHCRNLILENRNQDFEEGVSLYDQFLRNAEHRFAEEDFLIDTNSQMQELVTRNEQLTTENIQLKYRIVQMENQQNNQYNNCVIYNAPVYSTTNNNYNYTQTQQSEDAEPATEDVQQSSTYPFVVTDKLNELGLYSISEFEDKYREAVKGGANILAPFLKNYRDLKVLDLGGRNKKETYEVLKAFFGDDLDFGYTNFAAYF